MSARTAASGYDQYEISAYAKQDRQSRHNINYWQYGDYIGIGAGAHGKLSALKNDKLEITRRWKHRQPQQYMENTFKQQAFSGEQTLKHHDIVFEFLLNALRLKNGSDKTTFERHTGLGYQQLRESLRDIDSELLDIDEQHFKTSDKGFLFLNEILEKLI